MNASYRKDVESKINSLNPLAQEIHCHLLTMAKGAGLTMSCAFRAKGIERIAEKDFEDYAGPTSSSTQVKDIYAARLCPNATDGTLTDEQVKDQLQAKLVEYFDNIKSWVYLKKYPYKIDNKKITVTDGREFNIRYMTFLDHIELQVLTVEEYFILESAHEEFERQRAGLATTTHVSVTSPSAGSQSSESMASPSLQQYHNGNDKHFKNHLFILMQQYQLPYLIPLFTSIYFVICVSYLRNSSPPSSSLTFLFTTTLISFEATSQAQL
jgi:hypothetical protein